MRWIRPLLVAPALLAAGCVAEPLDADPAGEGTPSGAGVVVVADDLWYAPSRIEVVSGEPTTIHLRNEGGIVHDLVLDDGWSSGEVAPGRSVSVTLDARSTSTVAWCSVPGHRDAGMELDVRVVPPSG